MANVHRLRIVEPYAERPFPVDSATVIEVGDMVYMEANDVRPASDLTYGASLGDAQADFARKFVGIAMTASANGETRPVTVARGGLFAMACASATFEVGDLVSVDDNGAGDTLEDQQVIATGATSVSAIGRVAERVGVAATEVLVNITPHNHVEPDIAIPITIYKGLHTSAADLVTDWVVPFPFKLIRVDVIATILTAGAGVISIHKNTTALDDTITVPDASAVGASVEQAISDATGDDYFDMGDTLSVVSDGTPTAGEIMVILWVKPFLLQD